MYLCGDVCFVQPSCLSVVGPINVNVVHYLLMFQLFSFILVVVKGTFDFEHLTPSVDVQIGAGHCRRPCEFISYRVLT